MERVVITGIGAVTPIGIGVSAFWSGILEGRSGIKPVTLVDPKRVEEDGSFRSVRVRGFGRGAG